MITFHDVEQGSEQWHKLRDLCYVTGSKAWKLLQHGAQACRAKEKRFYGNFYTKRGHVLENQAISLYEKIYKTVVRQIGFITNSKYKFCGYSPDGIDGEYLLEVKAFNMVRHLKIAKGDIPFEIMAQIQFGLLITGLKKARLILYNPDFAKKELNGRPNEQYDPKMAFVVKEVKVMPSVHANFRKLIKQFKAS